MYMVVWLATPIFLRWSLGLKPSEIAFLYLSRSCSSVRAPGSCSKKEKKRFAPGSSSVKWGQVAENWRAELEGGRRVVGGWLEGGWRVVGGWLEGSWRVHWRVEGRLEGGERVIRGW